MRFSTAFAAAFALAASVSASPMRIRRSDINVATQSPVPTFSDGRSFNNYGGRQQSGNFDNFYGHGNFVGRFNEEIIIEERAVCDQVDIRVIQQKLAVILENAKRILIEEVCDFETQIIIHEQFFGRHKDFGKDLRHQSGRRAGYDRDVANRYGSIYQSNGDRQRNDMGFDGWNIGKKQVRLGQAAAGWDSNSPSAAKQAKQAAEQAARDQRPDSEKKPSKQQPAQQAPAAPASPEPVAAPAYPAPAAPAPAPAAPAAPEVPAPAPVAQSPPIVDPATVDPNAAPAPAAAVASLPNEAVLSPA